ncbi:MAG: cyclic nucleotide-binding domain-containing protein [Bdellovibrio sp.]|nr:cyclic nucleotide-binding domain-containing protein [Bdellovibrio sp.]
MSSNDSSEDITSLKANTVLFCEGEPSAYMYIIKRGKIQIVKEDKGTMIPISILKAQDFVGELSLFDDAPRSASAIAIEDSEVILVKKNEMRKMLNTCPEWVTNILNTLCERLKDSVEILRQHHIIDDLEQDPKINSPERLVKISKMVMDYKRRKGL